MKAYILISILGSLSSVFTTPIHNGMVFYHMPYYNPYQTMLVQYSPQSPGRSSSTSAFATGDAVAAGSVMRENRVENEILPPSVDQQSSTNDGNVEAIAEAFPEEPIDGAVQYNQDEPYHEVIPLSVVPVTGASNNDQAPKQQDISVTVPDEQQVQPTDAPKKKVHISLDIPDNTEIHDETENDEDDTYSHAPPKPNRPAATGGGSPVYTLFPVTFGRTAGGTIAIANAYSTGKGAVRSHAIAYGTSGASRRQAIERHIAAQKKAQ